MDYFVGGRGDRRRWDRALDRFLDALGAEEQDEAWRAFAEEELTTMPRRKAEWMETAASWRELTRSALSDEAIMEWDPALPRRAGAG